MESAQPSTNRMRASVDEDRGLITIPIDRPPGETLRPVNESGGGPAATANQGYEVKGVLGRGGMGIVHRATQRAFGRPIALKSLLKDDEPARRSFLAEAVATGLLEHPNIVPVHDLLIGPGAPRLVMKMVEGDTWKRLLHPQTDDDRRKVGDWEITRHLEILLKVCDAMAFAHGHSILHRDLKPENVMVGSYGEVLVMDWGCAAAFGDLSPHDHLPLASSQKVIAGTPAYMSPEQARGDGKAMGPWSDVYLLGAVLYEILTDSPPHRGANARETVKVARKGVIQPPEERNPGRAIPDQLAAHVLRALEADPAKRLRDVEAFAAGVREWLRHSQASVLLDRAREHLRNADDGRAADADEHYRRAIGACEQAQDLWPGYRSARRLFVRATLDAAKHSLATSAFDLAARQARAAGEAASELGLRHEAGESRKIEDQATRHEQDRRARARQVFLLSRALGIGGGGVMIALIVGLVIIGRSLSSERAAKDQAQNALERLGREQEERTALSRQAAPRFVAEAREHQRAFRWVEARAAAVVATGLDPELVEAWLILAEVEAGAGHLTEASEAFTRAGESRLARLCDTWLKGAAGDGFDEQERLAFAKELAAAGSAVAASHLSGDTRDGMLALLDKARLQILALHPKRGELRWSVEAGEGLVRVDCSGNEWLTDITPLAGLAVTHLNLSRTGVRNLHPLGNMGLRELRLDDCPIEDLSPLRGLAGLQRLTLKQCDQLTDLSTLAGTTLTALDLGGCTGITSFAPLAKIPLQELSLAATRIQDLGPLKGLRLSVLYLDGTRVTDLRPLADLPLRRLSLVKTGVVDLSPLARTSLEHLDLSNTDIANLAPLTKVPLQRLTLRDARLITDLTPLAGSTITWLDLRGTSVSDCYQLVGLTHLREVADGVLPGLSLLPPGTSDPDPDTLAQWAADAAVKLRSHPILVPMAEGADRLAELARWKRSGGRGDPPGATKAGDLTWSLLAIPVTWDEARRITGILGGRLPAIGNEASADALSRAFPGRAYHLGASRGRGEWRWLDGSPVERGRWAPGQPDSAQGSELYLAARADGWHDLSATERLPILVEWRR